MKSSGVWVKKGIGSGVHYPVPIHLQEAYRSLGYRARSLPNRGAVCQGIRLAADVS